MRSAPSVSVPVGRSHIWGRLALALWLLGLASLAGWGAWGGAAPVPQGGAAVALVLVGGLAWRGVLRQPEGRLAWDGQAWRWCPAVPGREAPPGAGREVEVQVACDLQRSLLLRLSTVSEPARGPVWLWLEAGAARADWPALRRAVYSRRTSEAHPEGPAATP